jgi:hypothetical protein
MEKKERLTFYDEEKGQEKTKKDDCSETGKRTATFLPKLLANGVYTCSCRLICIVRFATGQPMVGTVEEEVMGRREGLTAG